MGLNEKYVLCTFQNSCFQTPVILITIARVRDWSYNTLTNIANSLLLIL